MTPAQLTALHDEVTTQAKYAAAYSAKDCAGIQAIYNAATEVGAVDLALVDAYLKSHYINATDAAPAYWMLKTMSAGTTQPQAQLAGMILDLFTSRLGVLDMSITVAQTLFTQVVNAAVLSTQIQTDIMALATHPRNAQISEIATALYNPDGSIK